MEDVRAKRRRLRVDLIADPACPWCYLGLARLNKAKAMRPEIEIDLHWWPYLLNPQLPEDGMDRQAYLRAKFGSEDKAKAVYARIEAAGREDGIDFAFDAMTTTPNTVQAQRMILHAKEKALEVPLLAALFKAVFEQGMDIGRIDTLKTIGAAVGLDRDALETFFQGDDHSAAIMRGHQRAEMMGVRGVPVYVVEKEHVIAGAQAPEVLAGLFDLSITGKVA